MKFKTLPILIKVSDTSIRPKCMKNKSPLLKSRRTLRISKFKENLAQDLSRKVKIINGTSLNIQILATFHKKNQRNEW